MSIVRVRPEVQAIVTDPATHERVTLRAGDEFEHDDPIPKAFPWAFQSDAKSTGQGRVRSVRVEQATANPGELR